MSYLKLLSPSGLWVHGKPSELRPSRHSRWDTRSFTCLSIREYCELGNHTVNRFLSTNFFCFVTGSGEIPITRTFVLLKTSSSGDSVRHHTYIHALLVVIPLIASLNWHASLVQPYVPTKFKYSKQIQREQ